MMFFSPYLINKIAKSGVGYSNDQDDDKWSNSEIFWSVITILYCIAGDVSLWIDVSKHGNFTGSALYFLFVLTSSILSFIGFVFIFIASITKFNKWLNSLNIKKDE